MCHRLQVWPRSTGTGDKRKKNDHPVGAGVPQWQGSKPVDVCKSSQERRCFFKKAHATKGALLPLIPRISALNSATYLTEGGLCRKASTLKESWASGVELLSLPSRRGCHHTSWNSLDLCPSLICIDKMYRECRLLTDNPPWNEVFQFKLGGCINQEPSPCLLVVFRVATPGQGGRRFREGHDTRGWRTSTGILESYERPSRE